MLILESYQQHEQHLPAIGKFIIAQYSDEHIIIYQAFKDSIADYAVKHQHFGGNDYDFGRMTWLKPSFLWMMYYSGWAKKENQENVLAIQLSRKGFDEILRYAVMSSFYKNIYGSSANWERELSKTDIQFQWEPYHDLLGNKTERKAVKIGIKGEMLWRYNNEWIQKIENITPFVREQQRLIKTNKFQELQLPHERAYCPDDLTLLTKIDATTISL
ncbi:MAG TPA: DUF4291 domain-containing protein [Candidatus Babeliaceae bacterium]|nr:DUF4291 domain-containing protein [Candidatus Babeliaceae bacterium]